MKFSIDVTKFDQSTFSIKGLTYNNLYELVDENSPLYFSIKCDEIYCNDLI